MMAYIPLVYRNANNIRNMIFEITCEIKDRFHYLQESLTSGNYDKFVSLITSEITSQMEKAVLKTAFNRVSSLIRQENKQHLKGLFLNSL